jgi:hypothetical protein
VRTFWLVGSLALLHCSTGLSSSELPSEEGGGLLSGAVLLPLTTRSSEGLLGAVWVNDAHRIERARRAMRGTVRRDETRQHVEVLRRTELLADVGATTLSIGASAGASRQTDVAYSVDITGYETLDSNTGDYAAESGCCFNGHVTAACQGGFVGRVLRGSGKLRYLRRLTADASASAGPVLHARGGARYELVDETSFTDAFFAFVPEPLENLCAHLAPEAEIAPIHVVASDNCLIRVYTAHGGPSQLAHATYYPNAEACWAAAEQVCKAQNAPVVACPATFRDADGTLAVHDFGSAVAGTRAAAAAAASAGAPGATTPAAADSGPPMAAASVAPPSSATPPSPPPR